jgi:hypothetical protein
MISLYILFIIFLILINVTNGEESAIFQLASCSSSYYSLDRAKVKFSTIHLGNTIYLSVYL